MRDPFQLPAERFDGPHRCVGFPGRDQKGRPKLGRFEGTLGEGGLDFRIGSRPDFDDQERTEPSRCKSIIVFKSRMSSFLVIDCGTIRYDASP